MNTLHVMCTIKKQDADLLELHNVRVYEPLVVENLPLHIF